MGICWPSAGVPLNGHRPRVNTRLSEKLWLPTKCSSGNKKVTKITEMVQVPLSEGR